MPRRENAREKILDAAEELVIDKGIDALTMDSIAMMTGLGKGGVLYHFNYKVDLMQGMIERHVERSEIVLEKGEVKTGDDVYDWLDHYIEYIFGDRGDLFRCGIAVFAAASRYPQLMKPVKAFYDRRQRRILSQVKDPQLAAIIILAVDGFGMFNGLALSPIAEAEIAPVRERLRAAVEDLRQQSEE